MRAPACAHAPPPTLRVSVTRSVADLAEELMAIYGSCLALDAITGVVLSVLNELRPGDDAYAECVRHLDRLAAETSV